MDAKASPFPRFLASKRGSVFLLAMVALIVLLLLGTSLIQTSIQGLAFASKDRRNTEAFCLAESGVDMAITKLYEDYDGINATIAAGGPYSDSFSLSQGSVSYTVTAPYQGIADSCLIVSDSTTWTGRQARIRVIACYERDVSRVFEGAIFCDSPLRLNGSGGVYPDSSGEGGDIYAHGDITFNGTSFTMSSDGSVFTTGTTNWVPSQVPSTHVHENIATLTMPVIDLDYYRSIATKVYSGNKTFNSGDLTGLSGVIYVNGNVKISGNYTGQAVIVATGTITVTGNVETSNPTTDTLALLSPKSIKINGNSTVHGLVYAHSVVDDAEVTLSGNITVYGAIVSDVVRTNGGVEVYYRDVWKGLPLPGQGKTQWAPVSWQQLYL
jgi:cytoskeletal protein CcmA (bactofilin family)